MSDGIKIFRWRAVGPLLVLFVVACVLWWLFADAIARRESQSVGTALLGAKVEIQYLHLDLAHGDVTIKGLTIASPHEAFKNLLQADELVADIDVLPLTEKKLVIDRIVANGLRFGTPRETDGRVPAESGRGIAGSVLAETREWASRFQIPALQLATGKIGVDSLDPRRLSTIPAADALGARADSSRRAWQTAFDTLRLGPTLDSASATLAQLRRARATDLATINMARQAIGRLKRARDRVTTLERTVQTGGSQLQAGLAGLDGARQRDYVFARSLLKLPSLDAPAIGAAVFGPGAIKPFEQALYYTQLARRYMPPGLLPRAATGPSRVRRAGENVRFPKERALPAFLLRSAELSFLPQRYAGRLTGLTSDPALYGRPTAFAATGPQLAAGAMVNHTRSIPLDTAGATVGGVPFPAFDVPGVPLRLDPGAATTELGFSLKGDTIHARFAIRSSNVRWTRDSGFANSAIGNLVWRAVSGISNLDVETRLSGALEHPALAVRSNLDQAIAARLRAELGAKVDAAEKQMRARVDALVDAKVGSVRARVTEVQSQAQARVAQQRARIDELQKGLEQRLRQLLGGVRLP